MPERFFPAYLHAGLAEEVYLALVAAGRAELATKVREQAVRTPEERAYIEAMEEIYHAELDENDYDIDRDEMVVSLGAEGEGGAYVMLWRWVHRSETNLEPVTGEWDAGEEREAEVS